MARKAGAAARISSHALDEKAAAGSSSTRPWLTPMKVSAAPATDARSPSRSRSGVADQPSLSGFLAPDLLSSDFAPRRRLSDGPSVDRVRAVIGGNASKAGAGPTCRGHG